MGLIAFAALGISVLILGVVTIIQWNKIDELDEHIQWLWRGMADLKEGQDKRGNEDATGISKHPSE